MTLLLKLSQLIDWLNERVGKGAFWLVLIMAIVYFMINAVRAKNQALNEKILADRRQQPRKEPSSPSPSPAPKRTTWN